MCYAPELRVPDALMPWRAHLVKDDMTLQGCLEANAFANVRAFQDGTVALMDIEILIVLPQLSGRRNIRACKTLTCEPRWQTFVDWDVS